MATQAARLYEWPNTSFFYEAESLRLFYADPARSKQANEKCVVTAPSTKFVSGNVVFSGGGWYRRDYRKLSLSVHLAAHFARACVRPMEFGLHDQHHGREGHQGRHGGALRLHQRRLGPGLTDSPVGNVRCGFVWMERQQLLNDLTDTLARFDDPGRRSIADQ